MLSTMTVLYVLIIIMTPVYVLIIMQVLIKSCCVHVVQHVIIRTNYIGTCNGVKISLLHT